MSLFFFFAGAVKAPVASEQMLCKIRSSDHEHDEDHDPDHEVGLHFHFFIFTHSPRMTQRVFIDF